MLDSKSAYRLRSHLLHDQISDGPGRDTLERGLQVISLPIRETVMVRPVVATSRLIHVAGQLKSDGFSSLSALAFFIRLTNQTP